MIYFCGHSLGLEPKRARELVLQGLDTWATRGIDGFLENESESSWARLEARCCGPLSRLVGAQENEIAVMHALTVNLHLLLASFYKPTRSRYKILIEAHAFPSDRLAVTSHLAWHGLAPADALIQLGTSRDSPLSTRAIGDCLAQHGSSIALILWPGVQFYSGQVFDLAALAVLARFHGCLFGLDLAHSIGNLPLALHDWHVDFAVGCSYKYLNGGPGSIGICFVHAKYLHLDSCQQIGHVVLQGWWGIGAENRFQLENEKEFRPDSSVKRFQLSTPSILAILPLCASLELFEMAGLLSIHHKARRLTAYLRHLLSQMTIMIGRGDRNIPETNLNGLFTFLTPEPSLSLDGHSLLVGAQLSLRFIPEHVAYRRTGGRRPDLASLVAGLGKKARLVVDARLPDVLRMAPMPLYNSYREVREAVLRFQIHLLEWLS